MFKMLFPKISDLPPVTTSLIIINGLVFAYGIITGTQDRIIANYGFIPNYLFYGNHPFSDNITRLFSSMFLHAGIAHIAFNLFALAYLGGFAEKSVGKTRYLGIYIAAGIAGALLHGTVYTLAIGNGSGVLIGASGAISGVMGITAALGNIRGYYWLAIQILYAFIGSVVSIPIAFTAHVGGFLTGLLLTKLLIAIERKRRGQYLY
ncbi:MAG: rhomboid family intramembrane serine protease [Thaumarchaeota archaeon]|nr:MAG: rhomboid family intramembrane serine protease [Nitrososphaerota archaeon]